MGFLSFFSFSDKVYVAQAGLKLLGSNDPSFSQVGEHHHARLELITWENHSVRFLFL
jgi:hypothetical protein